MYRANPAVRLSHRGGAIILRDNTKWVVRDRLFGKMRRPMVPVERTCARFNSRPYFLRIRIPENYSLATELLFFEVPDYINHDIGDIFPGVRRVVSEAYGC